MQGLGQSHILLICCLLKEDASVSAFPHFKNSAHPSRGAQCLNSFRNLSIALLCLHFLTKNWVLFPSSFVSGKLIWWVYLKSLTLKLFSFSSSHFRRDADEVGNPHHHPNTFQIFLAPFLSSSPGINSYADSQPSFHPLFDCLRRGTVGPANTWEAWGIHMQIALFSI